MSSQSVPSTVPSDPVIAEAFQRQGHVVIKSLMPRAQVAQARDHLLQRTASGTMATDTTLGTVIPSLYGDPLLDEILHALKPRVEYCTGLALYPTYSFARVYKTGDRLPPHRDRRACEISISVNLGQQPETPWALCLEGRDKIKAAAMLHPGDGLIYRGIELTHWREPYEGEQLLQTFMHYVDQNGPNAGERYDRRAALGTPHTR